MRVTPPVLLTTPTTAGRPRVTSARPHASIARGRRGRRVRADLDRTPAECCCLVEWPDRLENRPAGRGGRDPLGRRMSARDVDAARLEDHPARGDVGWPQGGVARPGRRGVTASFSGSLAAEAPSVCCRVVLFRAPLGLRYGFSPSRGRRNASAVPDCLKGVNINTYATVCLSLDVPRPLLLRSNCFQA